jgi:signal transduction histidine kinase
MSRRERDQNEVLKRRVERERRARKEAEAIAERVTAELYAAVTALGETNEKLEAANDAIREFVAVASHDIRTPLTVITGASDLLLEQKDALSEGQRDQLLTSIVERGAALTRLVDDLLTISKLDAGAVEAHTEAIKIGLELDRAMNDVGVGTGVTVDGSRDLAARVDRDHLQRILVNYLSNAMKYGEPPIDVRLAEAGGFVEIRITDRGPGVPADLAPRLFGKFARGSSASLKTGTGLGLSIVRGLAIANGGDAWYEPAVPRGACFAVKLPQAATA